MAKYILLVVLNVPFVIFGCLRAFEMRHEGTINFLSFLMRLVFWTTMLLGLILAAPIYNYLVSNDLTNSTPLSLADVVLVTGVNFCLFLCIRLYAKIDKLEQRMTEMHEKLSVHNSKRGPKA